MQHPVATSRPQSTPRLLCLLCPLHPHRLSTQCPTKCQIWQPDMAIGKGSSKYQGCQQSACLCTCMYLSTAVHGYSPIGCGWHPAGLLIVVAGVQGWGKAVIYATASLSAQRKPNWHWRLVTYSDKTLSCAACSSAINFANSCLVGKKLYLAWLLWRECAGGHCAAKRYGGQPPIPLQATRHKREQSVFGYQHLRMSAMLTFKLRAVAGPH